MFGLSCATHMRALLRLSLRVEILITDSTKLFLRSPMSPLSVAYVLVVLLLILIINMLNNFSMHLMILYGE
jgi:hypothetical protein